jgi:hypothetical protein
LGIPLDSSAMIWTGRSLNNSTNFSKFRQNPIDKE